MKNDKVKIDAWIPREVAEKVLSGELEFKNGLRNAKGPASFYSLQPEMSLSTSKNETLSRVGLSLLETAAPLVIAEVLPRLFARIDALVDKSTEPEQSTSEPLEKDVISLEEYRKASGL